MAMEEKDFYNLDEEDFEEEDIEEAEEDEEFEDHIMYHNFYGF